MKDVSVREKDSDCNKIEISIIVPVYNMELFLERCLSSVVIALEKLQDRAEVLIINDGSKDSSLHIILEYCKLYPYMKCFNKENGGLSDVKNYGLERAKGDFVIFLDSDDYIDPKMYEKMLQKAKEEDADVVVCDIELSYDDVKKNVVHPCRVVSRNSMFAQVIDMSMMPASWNKLVKRELYNGLTFPVGKNNEDIAVTPIVLARANKICSIDFPYYKYYQREGSIQNSTFSEKRFVVAETSKLCVERLKKENVDQEKVELIKGSVYLHQVLSLALYLIRREKICNRYRMLKKYMLEVEEMFPDIWSNFEVNEFVHWDTLPVQLFRKTSVFLLKRRRYLLLSLFWTPCNILYDCGDWGIKKIAEWKIKQV